MARQLSFDGTAYRTESPYLTQIAFSLRIIRNRLFRINLLSNPLRRIRKLISTTTRRFDGADMLRRFVQTFSCSLLVGSCTVAQSDDDLAEVIRAEYPDYSIRSGVFEGSCRDASENAVDSCIATGDFNSDGYKDMSAVLRRAITAGELADIDLRHRNAIRHVDLVIVCNGNRDSAYACAELAKPEIGGLPAVLEVAVWPEEVGSDDAVSMSGECRPLAEESPATPMLTLTEPNGLCRSFFYSSNEGRYKQCTICGD